MNGVKSKHWIIFVIENNFRSHKRIKEVFIIFTVHLYALYIFSNLILSLGVIAGFGITLPLVGRLLVCNNNRVFSTSDLLNQKSKFNNRKIASKWYCCRFRLCDVFFMYFYRRGRKVRERNGFIGFLPNNSIRWKSVLLVYLCSRELVFRD